MHANERKNKIISLTNDSQKVEIEELAKNLNVSTMTIRRDLTELENQGHLIRVHGGAVPVKELVAEVPYTNKASINLSEKKQIALLALDYIPENGRILMDSGTTTLEIIRLIKHRRDLTIITNDIKLAMECIDDPIEIILTGGEMQQGIGACTGPVAENFLSTIHADLFFLGAHAIHPKAGITAPTLEKANIKKKMIEASEMTVLVADSTKFNLKSFASVCSLNVITYAITNDNLSDEQLEEYTQSMSMEVVTKGD
ncbi:DeoR/GlpR family DNA-binding transcription regulator [Geomicrobium sp. JCM 19055]|uniref:DeoR/GlpR family DNA-binding transcription regulator n=1 Tax=Geomicrobium sp. JCM 19055 TaxID=1460649 RepID=UPI00045ED806|nr:DeoR/GlpR family DNA-binding transcription regulator [Geomicrobium sp. JCM 19055]GAK00602.1 transcriptional regulator [Geomicrobium sp. JCM 19055]